MTGNKPNNQQSGQVLLITIMLLATTLTVVMTNAFKSITDTQTTKLEEDSQKALAAAEAGIEKSLNARSGGAIPANTSIGSGELNDIQNVKTTLSTTTSKTYTTPLLPKDSQYTFYLSEYPSLSSLWTGDLNVFFYSESSLPALELTFIKSDNSLSRYIVQDGTSPVDGLSTSFSRPAVGTYIIEGISFKRKFAISSFNDRKLLLVKILGASSKLGFSSTFDLNKQGETISSEARTNTNVVKKVELRQSYPQIPAEFFTTSF